MIVLAEALNFRCLRYVSQPLKRCQVLIGPSASGKTAFLDVIGFLSDVVSHGLEHALEDRAADPRDILYQRRGHELELALEATVPDHVRQQSAHPDLDSVRYQVVIGFGPTPGDFEFKAEALLLKQRIVEGRRQQAPFPHPQSLQENSRNSASKTLINKAPGGTNTFRPHSRSKSHNPSPIFHLGPAELALGHLPADDTSFPVANWFRTFLATGVRRLAPDCPTIRKPSPPSRAGRFLPDGSSLSWIVRRLRKSNRKRHAAWIRHLQTVLPDLRDITSVLRPEDNHCYLVYMFDDGSRVPSWLVSEGTIRLTALTLPAYLAGLFGVFLVEGPETGIHPGSIATVYDSLRSMYDAQVLVATHSPAILSAARREDVLCFARDADGATEILPVCEHPRLHHWQGDPDLGTLLASGVLG